MGPELEKGMAALEELADRGIIPGTSIKVIRDRLIDGVCFCGTRLDEGSPAPAAGSDHGATRAWSHRRYRGACAGSSDFDSKYARTGD